MTQRKKTYKTKRYLVLILILIALAGLWKLYTTYEKVYEPNVNLQNHSSRYLYIPSGSEFNDVIKILNKENIIEDTESFKWLAQKKNYPNHVYPGRYLIKDQMSNNEIINLLRSGEQAPVDLIFNNIRTKKELASVVSNQIEADSAKLVHLLNNRAYLEKYEFTPQTALAMCIPNTYQIYWNRSAEEFIQRMHREYQKFWSKEKLQKARKVNMQPVEIITLASIVDEETMRNDEMEKIAGVYINRLEKGMRLQADPTIKFALKDFTIKRVLKKHLSVDSPYNTYKNAGLPPGPISIPSIAAINSVLNHEHHNYLYFCAKPDFSGYHNFSSTHYQHMLNAAKYQKALNKNSILK